MTRIVMRRIDTGMVIARIRTIRRSVTVAPVLVIDVEAMSDDFQI